MNFVDTDIREIAATVLGTMLGVNYAVDPAVHGTGTIKATKPLNRQQLLAALQTVLSQNGLTLLNESGLYRVLPTATASGSAIIGSGPASAGTEAVPLRYASAKDLAGVLQPFVAEGGKISADPERNVLIVSGDAAARAALTDLIRSFDTDLLAGRSYAVFPVAEGSPRKVASELEAALGSGENGPLTGMVRVVPMEGVNAVLVVANQPRYIDGARRLLGLIDQASDATARSWHVYYVQNGQSSDLERVLQKAFTPERVTSSDRLGPQEGRGATAPGMEETSLNAQAPGQNGDTNSTNSGSQAAVDSQGAQSQGTDEQNAPSTEALSPFEENSERTSQDKGIRIIANRTNNALLIYATPDEYGVIDGMLRKIDILPLQVRIDAMIAEVTLNDNLRYGTQLFFKSGGLQGFLSNTTVGTVAGEFPGFVLTRGMGSIRFAISALQAVTNVRVLSSPQVTVLDNQPARLQVGDLVPYITQTSVSTQQSGAPVVNSVDYRETGVILQVVPRVNSGGLVSLDIAQEVSDVRPTTSSTINSPTFLERKVRSRVVVQDGQTVGLAGLIRDNDSQGNSGVPWIKDIPLVGSLFGTQNNTRTRTELLVLITPEVIHDQRDARALTDDLRHTLGNASVVPEQLEAKPLSGSYNPHRAYVP